MDGKISKEECIVWLGFENISKIARKKMIKITKNDAVLRVAV